MKKVIKMIFGIIVMSLFLTACGSSDSTESKLIGVWKIEEPDKEVIYLEFTDDNLVLRELDGGMNTLHYYITDLENENFLLEVSKSDGGFKEIILEGIFKNKNTVSILDNPSSRYRYEDNEVQMVRVKNLEKDMEEETKKLSELEDEDAGEEDEFFSQEPSEEELSQELTEEELIAMEKEAREKEEMERLAVEEEEARVYDTEGEKLYSRNCASCHGGDLSGDLAPDLRSIGSNMSVEEIEKVIIDGTGAMPPGILAGDEAREVAEWLSEMK